jgi:2-keto-3-deoxy-L-fuconate dehydrogenase
MSQSPATNEIFSLRGKVAVITGGASGIGLAISKRFGIHGALIEVLDIDADRIVAAIQSIRGLDGDAFGELCDVGESGAVNGLFERIHQRRRRIDILVNCAGVVHIGNALNTSPEDFERVQRVNVQGVANCSQAALRYMVDQQRGAILNLASTVSHFGLANRFAYTASKGAVLAMTYSIAKDFLPHGIRCNALLPGRIHTPLVDAFIAKNYAGHEAEMFDKLSKEQPIGRMGTPEEVAAAAHFLCSDDAGFITGSGYPVDGGVLTLR